MAEGSERQPCEDSRYDPIEFAFLDAPPVKSRCKDVVHSTMPRWKLHGNKVTLVSINQKGMSGELAASRVVNR